MTFAPFSKLRVLERRFLPHILESGMLPPHRKSKSGGTDCRLAGSATVPERVEGFETLKYIAPEGETSFRPWHC